jgi:hypothetical protein
MPIFDVARFTDPALLKDILLPRIDLQLKWHRLRELEIDQKTEIPALSKLNKAQKAEEIVAAVGRWIPRVEAGEVPLMGHQLNKPVEPESKMLEYEDDEEDARYGDKD